MEPCTIRVLVDNTAERPWRSEHGLSLWIDDGRTQVLFDTGAGQALEPNLELAGLSKAPISHIVLSHGHNDHTGGLQTALRLFPHAQVLYGAGALRERYSLHEGRPPHYLQMSVEELEALAAHKRRQEVSQMLSFAPGFYLTGPIPRLSGEDCGGPFFFDLAGHCPDSLEDEQALLLENGTLIQGCCHSGIINTFEVCRERLPQIPIRRVIGGLHLVHATAERMRRTADYLNAAGLEELVLLHCTGAEAMDYLREHVHCRVICGQVGDVYHG